MAQPRLVSATPVPHRSVPEPAGAPQRIAVMRPRLPTLEHVAPYLAEMDASRWYGNFGPLQQRFEARLADRFAIAPDGITCVANATVGLTLALAAAAEPGGLCLMPSFTFVASAHAARAAGLMPCFVDVEPGSWALTPELARAALRRLGGRVAAVMPVAVFGAPPDPAAWDAFGADTAIPVVIDAAAAYDGARVGRGATVVSLHASKILGVGEGGFVAAGDAALVQSVRQRSNFGFHGRRTAEVAGMNGKISEYACAVGLAAMDRWEATRSALARVRMAYLTALAGEPRVDFAPGFAQGWLTTVLNVRLPAGSADRVIAGLTAHGVDARQWWDKGCHRQPAFADCPAVALPVTEALAGSVVGLPFHADLTPAEVATVAAALSATLDGIG